MINRRHFFARTFGAAFTGFAAALVPAKPRDMFPIFRRVIHPSGFSYSFYHSDLAILARQATLRARIAEVLGSRPPYSPADLEAGTYPHNAGETIR